MSNHVLSKHFYLDNAWDFQEADWHYHKSEEIFSDDGVSRKFVLGLEENSSIEDVLTAHRILVKNYLRYTSPCYSKSVIDRATAIMQVINTARDSILAT